MKILYLSLLDWFFTKQRPQHLAEGLSVKYNIDYLNIFPWNSFIKGISKYDKNKFFVKINNNLKVNRIPLLPLNKFDFIRKINSFILRTLIYFMHKMKHYDILWISHPDQLQWLPKIKFKHVIYDCMDKYDKFSNNKRYLLSLKKAEYHLIEFSDITFVSSNALKKVIKNNHKKSNIKLVLNGLDLSYFEKPLISNLLTRTLFNLKNKYDKIIGYVGAIGDWFDDDLLLDLSKSFPNYLFVLVGPINSKKVYNKLSSINNILFEGIKPYQEIPTYIDSFDVCLMPFKINEIVRFVNPVKVYEYLYYGKDIYLPYYDELLIFSKFVHFYDNTDTLISKLKSPLSFQKKHHNLIRERTQFARDNSWNKRVSFIIKCIKDLN